MKAIKTHSLKSESLFRSIEEKRKIFNSATFWKDTSERHANKAKAFIRSVDKYARELIYSICKMSLSKGNLAMICLFVAKDRILRLKEIGLPYKVENIPVTYTKQSLNYVGVLNKLNNNKVIKIKIEE